MQFWPIAERLSVGSPECLIMYKHTYTLTDSLDLYRSGWRKLFPIRSFERLKIRLSRIENWEFFSGDRQSRKEVDVLCGSLCWTWLPTWIKYGIWTCCSTLFVNNNILLRLISHRLRALTTSLTPFFLFDGHKQTHTDSQFQGWENATLPLPVNTETRGMGWNPSDLMAWWCR